MDFINMDATWLYVYIYTSARNGFTSTLVEFKVI